MRTHETHIKTHVSHIARVQPSTHPRLEVRAHPTRLDSDRLENKYLHFIHPRAYLPIVRSTDRSIDRALSVRRPRAPPARTNASSSSSSSSSSSTTTTANETIASIESNRIQSNRIDRCDIHARRDASIPSSPIHTRATANARHTHTHARATSRIKSITHLNLGRLEGGDAGDEGGREKGRHRAMGECASMTPAPRRSRSIDRRSMWIVVESRLANMPRS